MRARLNPDKPVAVRAPVFEGRPSINHYKKQTGVVTWVSGGVPEHAMVFWRGLSCSSLWAVRELKNVTRRTK